MKQNKVKINCGQHSFLIFRVVNQREKEMKLYQKNKNLQCSGLCSIISVG